MRAVHKESTFEPKLGAVTKFIIDIRPINRNSAALSSVNATNANNTSAVVLGVNTSTTNLECIGAVAALANGVHGGHSDGSGGITRNFMAEVNWRRVFTVSSLIASLLLISGSIYLHLQQKPHLGRLHHQQQQPSTAARAVAASTPSTIDTNIHSDILVDADADVNGASSGSFVAAKASGNSFTTTSSQITAPASSSMLSIDSQRKWNALPTLDSRSRHITEACMQCICQTVTECRPATCGNNMACGIFRISRPYWLDAGKPALEYDDVHSNNNNNKHNDNNNTTTTYTNCVNNPYCATRTVAAYINKYSRDCNGDGVIECRDHIALHLLGPSGCLLSSDGELSPIYAHRMQNCLAKYE